MDELIWISTRRYSEFFRRLLEHYGSAASVRIDRKTFGSAEIPSLLASWCTNAAIKATRDFTLSRDGRELFGFHDSPDQLWAVPSEISFCEALRREKILRFRILSRRPTMAERFASSVRALFSRVTQ